LLRAPSADLSAAFDALLAEGLADTVGKLKPLLAADAQFGNAASDVDMVNGAWNLERLAGVYDGFVGRYQPVLDELRADAAGDIDDESAFLLRILLIHDYRRLLLRDPELPDVLLPPTGPARRPGCCARNSTAASSPRPSATWTPTSSSPAARPARLATDPRALPRRRPARRRPSLTRCAPKRDHRGDKHDWIPWARPLSPSVPAGASTSGHPAISW
jgi:hypothetical protein